jgi:acetate kinase
MTGAILTINSGSSSIKFAIFEMGHARLPLICEGQIEGLHDSASFHAKDTMGQSLAEQPLGGALDHGQALDFLLKWLEERFSRSALVAAGHRVVHGGALFIAPARIDAAVMSALKALEPLAPLHQRHNLAAIHALSKLHSDLPQIACFDTAFHAGQFAQATNFALPRELTDQGIRRYGFHGLSYEYIASMLPQVSGPDTAEGRVIVAHLGSGTSLCALHRRKSIATTMGFTALDGLMMARRCGTIDPGVILYLMQEKAMSAASVSDLLYNRSGLLGVSGVSDDMRALLTDEDLMITRHVCAVIG